MADARNYRPWLAKDLSNAIMQVVALEAARERSIPARSPSKPRAPPTVGVVQPVDDQPGAFGFALAAMW